MSRPPCSMFSLLRHEHKRTAANFAISLMSSEHAAPLKSKEELVMQCGPRRFVVSPLFSDGGSTPSDVHRFRRYLHPGQTAVASAIAPLTWGSVPALFFVREAAGRRPAGDAMDTAAEGAPSRRLRLVGTGTSLPPSHSRVVAKRAVLTGHPFKIHKRLVTVRYMFFNAEDVAWFKAMRLWTRRGRTGFIKESLGTHGYFKATFDGSINSARRRRHQPRTRGCGRGERRGCGGGTRSLSLGISSDKPRRGCALSICAARDGKADVIATPIPAAHTIRRRNLVDSPMTLTANKSRSI